jgi:hybrid cluster-associated redox disulfide protein
MISKNMNMKEVIDKFPEVGPVLAQAGLHCVGCHASAGETIEQGCKAHGLTDKAIKDLVDLANDKIKLFDSLPQIKFTKKASAHLKEKLKVAKARYIRLMPIFGGFDFDAVNEKYENEILIDGEVVIVTSPSLERFLRGVTIDFDKKQDDFTAKRK